MKPDAYIPLYGDDLIRAVRGKPLIVKWSYWLALWHYWSHNHCKGLEDNDESLRDICEVRNDAEWAIVKPMIFGEDGFFSLDHKGLWQQARAQLLWAEKSSNYKIAMKRGHAGANARWGKK